MPADTGRLARAVLQVYHHDPAMPAHARAKLSEVIHAGRCVEYAERLRAHAERRVSRVLAEQYAVALGIGLIDLRTSVLPLLKAAGVVDYQLVDGRVSYVEEYVGLSAPFLEQVVNVLEACGPADEQWAALASIQLGTLAPLARSDHLQRLSQEFEDETTRNGLRLALAAGVLRRVPSSALTEDVIFNPAVWGSEAVDVAGFLRGLPSDERAALLAVVELTNSKRGLALPSTMVPAGIVTGARRIGLIQAATVKSTAAGAVKEQTYLFPPLNVVEDGARGITEALHERKLVAAHFMFGHDKALSGRGVIRSPVVLVNSLLRRGAVGPASNIGTDYHLLEAAGIVTVDPGVSRPYLRLVKEDIVRDALGWLHQIYGSDENIDAVNPRLPNSPGQFVTPEADRAALPDDEAAAELADSTILRLREEMARGQRGEHT